MIRKSSCSSEVTAFLISGSAADKVCGAFTIMMPAEQFRNIVEPAWAAVFELFGRHYDRTTEYC
jgi:hypothetical protein